MPPKTPSKSFLLVRWLEEESIGIVPFNSVCVDDKSRVMAASTVRVKWGKKFFDAEILKVHSNRQNLKTLCDKLINFEITIEEVLAEVSSDVKVTPGSDVHRSTSDETVDSTTCETKAKKLKSDYKKVKQAQIDATKARATEIFSTTADDESENNESVLESKLRHQEEMISQLKKQLDDITSKSVVTNNMYRSSQNNIKYELHQNKKPSNTTPMFSPSLSPFSPTPEQSSFSKSKSASPTIDFESPIIEQTPPGAGLPNPKRLKMEFETIDRNNSEHKIQTKIKPTMIELVPGYGIVLTQRQLDEAISSSGSSPTKLMRNLISVFFTPSVLATSSCCGSRMNQALDEDVVAACIKFVQSKYSVAKSVLVEAINDKCATARRKIKKKETITIDN